MSVSLLEKKVLCQTAGLKADSGKREVWGYAATFGNVDNGGDRIEKGAFARTIRERFTEPLSRGQNSGVKFLYQHRSDLVLGRLLELREDSTGLYFRARISETQLGNDTLTLLHDGAIEGVSIGYNVVKADREAGTGVNVLRELKLWEVSLVTFAMNELASVHGVKEIGDLRFHFSELAKSLCRLADRIRDLERKTRARNAVDPFELPEDRKLREDLHDFQVLAALGCAPSLESIYRKHRAAKARRRAW